MSELKPCPFCGSEAKIFHEYERWSVYCDNLNCQIRTVGTWEHKTKKKQLKHGIGGLAWIDKKNTKKQ